MIMPSEDEMKIIRESILFPFLMQVIDRDKEIIANSTMKLKDSYVGIFEHVSNRVFADKRKVNDQLRLMNIKIYKQVRDKDGIKSNFVCRGYHSDTYYRWTDMREEIKVRIRYYFGCKVIF